MTDITAYDDQVESDVATLFRRASQSVPAPRLDLVDGAIAAGEARIGVRRRRHLTGLVASAALVGCLGTAGGVVITDDGRTGNIAAPVAVHFGLSPDQMAPTLAQVLTDAGEVSEVSDVTADGSLPAWTSQVEGALRVALPPASSAVRTASATYRIGGKTTSAQVAVVIEHRDTKAAMTDVLPAQIMGSVDGTVQRTAAGVVLYQGGQGGKPDGPAHGSGRGSGPGVATLMTSDGWVVRAFTPNLGAVPLKVLAQVAQNPAWLG